MFINKGTKFKPFGDFGEKKETDLNRATREYFSKTADRSKFVKHKFPKANLRLYRQKVLEISFVATLALLITAVQFSKQFTLAAKPVKKMNIQIEVADIPPTQQFHRPPPPPRPSIPIPTEDESVPEDLTIASTNIDLSNIPPPPAPPEDDMNIFVAYDEPPRIIGGIAELQKHLKYPRIAQRAGVEGIVFVKVLVGTNGQTERTEILKSKPENMGFEESALEAMRQVKWEPAKQRDKKIRVWVSIPVAFKLAG